MSACGAFPRVGGTVADWGGDAGAVRPGRGRETACSTQRYGVFRGTRPAISFPGGGQRWSKGRTLLGIRAARRPWRKRAPYQRWVRTTPAQ